MADFNVPDLHLQNTYAGPDGNLSRHYAELSIAASATRAVNDRDFVAPLPEGMEIHNVTCVVENTVGSSATVDVGMAQRNGLTSFNLDGKFRFGSNKDESSVFMDGMNVNAAGRQSSDTRHPPIRVEDPEVFLVVDWQSAVSSSEDVLLRFYIDYMWVGNL